MNKILVVIIISQLGNGFYKSTLGLSILSWFESLLLFTKGHFLLSKINYNPG
jgi:hypothetical protein